MTTSGSFDRRLADWLHEEAEHRVPDHLDEVLVRTVATRQRPWWSSPERWLPMDLTTPRPAVMRRGTLSHPLVALLLVALVAAALVAVAIGTRRSDLEPFGLARNGTWLGSFDGDLFRIDPRTGERTVLVGGDGFDFSPIFTRDGTRVVFVRSDGPPAEPAVLTLMAARPDGTDVRAITAPMERLDWWDTDPGGSRVAFISAGRLFVAPLDGGGARRLPTSGPVQFPTWLPPDGDEILFRLEGPTPAIMAIRPDGSGLRTLSPTPADDRFDYHSISASPDGRSVGFTRWSAGGFPKAYVLDIATGRERAIPMLQGASQWGPLAFAPDGALVAYAGILRAGRWQVVVAPADGSDPGRAVGPAWATDRGGVAGTWAFTPDGTGVLVREGDDASSRYHLIGLDDGSDVSLGSGDFGFIDIQRLAP